MKPPVIMVVVLLAGCAGVQSVGELGVRGFRVVDTGSGPHHQLWAKETRDGRRTVDICIVPTVRTREYYWWIRLSVDEKEVWADSNVVRSFSPETKVACVTSNALPEGQLSYWMSFQYQDSKGVDQSASSVSAPPQLSRADTTTASRPEVTRDVPSDAFTPVWDRGYEWKFRWSSSRGSGTFVWTVAGETMVSGVPYYILRTGSRDIYYAKADLAWLMERVDGGVEVRATPPNRLLEWPLFVGKEWEQTYTWENPGERRTEERLRRHAVEGWVVVNVPAGSFWAFHVTSRDPTGRLTSEYWYAPEVRWIVKDRYFYSYGVQERELLEYKLKATVAPLP